jgi:hypothetical protein
MNIPLKHLAGCLILDLNYTVVPHNYAREKYQQHHYFFRLFTAVAAERFCIDFEDKRRRQPHAVQYKNFYGCIEPEAKKPRTPRMPASKALSGIDLCASPGEFSVSRSQSHLQSRDSTGSNNQSNGWTGLSPGP